MSGDWPVKGGEAAEGTSGVVEAVAAGDGTIGYADESQAGELGIATIKVGSNYAGTDRRGRREDPRGVPGSKDIAKSALHVPVRTRPQDRNAGAPTRSSWSPT